jgi:hypothetical protein
VVDVEVDGGLGEECEKALYVPCQQLVSVQAAGQVGTVVCKLTGRRGTVAGSPLPKEVLASQTMSVVSALPVTTTWPSAGGRGRQQAGTSIKGQHRHTASPLASNQVSPAAKSSSQAPAQQQQPAFAACAITRRPSSCQILRMAHPSRRPPHVTQATQLPASALTAAGGQASHHIFVVAQALQQAAILGAVSPAHTYTQPHRGERPSAGQRSAHSADSGQGMLV